VTTSKEERSRRRSGLRLFWGLAFFLITLAFGVSIAIAGPAGKSPFNPWAGLSDDQKQAIVDKTHAQNARYLQDFEARRGDPRSLPIIKVSTYEPPSASVEKAASQALVIVHGHVGEVHFISNPNGGMPRMLATVTVTHVGKGSVGATILVSQSGGPVAQPGGKGAIVELEYEHLALPNDEVLLLLTPVQGTNPAEYRTMYGPGVLVVQNGQFSGESAKRYGLDQRNFEAVWRSLIDGSLTRGAFQLQTTGAS